VLSKRINSKTRHNVCTAPIIQVDSHLVKKEKRSLYDKSSSKESRENK